MRDLVDQMGGGRGSMPRGDEAPAENVASVELTLMQHYDTGKAVLVSEAGDENLAKWIPHSTIEKINSTGKFAKVTRKNGQIVDCEVINVTIPDWLAKDKGLV